VFVIAHEMGHAMHTFYSNATQCYEKADYRIFVAEIASTVNEVLLLKHLLKTAKGEERKYLLSYYLDMFRTTLFRQTMFAEFEKYAHDEYEAGRPLTAENMSAKYYELNKAYYGPGVIHDKDIEIEWARIPHFYNAFYVYKYATGLTTAVNIVNKLLTEEGYLEKYLKFLSTGGSLYPLPTIEIADVDLKSKEPFEFAMGEFKKTLDELLKI
jgi:oligoendopeptidase F